VQSAPIPPYIAYRAKFHAGLFLRGLLAAAADVSYLMGLRREYGAVVMEYENTGTAPGDGRRWKIRQLGLSAENRPFFVTRVHIESVDGRDQFVISVERQEPVVQAAAAPARMAA
jgi:hypothetical protein